MAGLSKDNIQEAKSLWEESHSVTEQKSAVSADINESQGSMANSITIRIQDLYEKARVAYLAMNSEDMFEIMKQCRQIKESIKLEKQFMMQLSNKSFIAKALCDESNNEK